MKALQSRVNSETNGTLTLNIGEVPEATEVVAGIVAGDGPEPYEILARLYAHLAHRIPVARSVAKKFEGTGNSSGPFADLMALAAALVKRNEQLIEIVAKQAVTDMATAAKTAADTRKEKRSDRSVKPFRFGRRKPSEQEQPQQEVSSHA